MKLNYLSMNTLSPKTLYGVRFTTKGGWRKYHIWGKEIGKLKFLKPNN